MTIRSMTLAAAVVLAASASLSAQTRTDRAFTATGTSCEEVNWSREVLQRAPNIAEACQEVMQRDGKYYVKFQGEVERVTNRGRELTVAFKGGDTITLNPPENMTVIMNDRPRPVSALRPGDQLNFYVPEDRFTARFAAEDASPAAQPDVAIAPAPPQRVAAAEPPEETPPAAELPETAGALPTIGLAGLLLAALGATLTVIRRRSQSV